MHCSGPLLQNSKTSYGVGVSVEPGNAFGIAQVASTPLRSRRMGMIGWLPSNAPCSVIARAGPAIGVTLSTSAAKNRTRVKSRITLEAADTTNGSVDQSTEKGLTGAARTLKSFLLARAQRVN